MALLCPKNLYIRAKKFEAPQATATEELTQGPKVAERAGFETATLQSIRIDSNSLNVVGTNSIDYKCCP